MLPEHCTVDPVSAAFILLLSDSVGHRHPVPPLDPNWVGQPPLLRSHRPHVDARPNLVYLPIQVDQTPTRSSCLPHSPSCHQQVIFRNQLPSRQFSHNIVQSSLTYPNLDHTSNL